MYERSRLQQHRPSVRQSSDDPAQITDSTPVANVGLVASINLPHGFAQKVEIE